MSAFASLSAPVRALFTLWTLLLCLTDVGSAALAAVGKRVRFTVLALLLLTPTYLLWQVLFDLSLFGATSAAVRLSVTLGKLPWLRWLAALCLLTLAAALLFAGQVRHNRTAVTPGTVKRFLDKIPCGVCCWRESGRVLFSNDCMNRLCAALTGGPLLNGNSFRDAAVGAVLNAEGRVWRFSCRDLSFDGETLHEMIASDITAEYAKTQALERDRAELAQMNRDLRNYYRSIDEVVRRQEILQARANIHDEMNRLMLSTTAADREDTAVLDRIFSLWEQNALLLCKEAARTADTETGDSLENLAAALGVRLVWQTPLPDTLQGWQRALFFSAAREALANAVKHARAKTVTVSFTETEPGLCCRIANDGTPPREAVCFTGGLANLSCLAAERGASVEIGSLAPFTLCLRFHDNLGKEGATNGI